MGRQPAKVTKRRKPSRSASRTRAPVGETLPSGAAPALAGTAPIVGIGASAGGVDAVSQLLRHLPSDTGLAFVVIQHLSPSQPSQLSAVLARSTAMSVVQAETGMRPEPDHVYVIPPGVEMVLSGGRLVVGAAEGARATPRSIDLFLASLAKAEQGRAIGVILSGSGSDGVEGLSAIRAEAGSLWSNIRPRRASRPCRRARSPPGRPTWSSRSTSSPARSPSSAGRRP